MTFRIVYPKEVERLRKEKRAILVDIRPKSKYQEGHWEGAINYPETENVEYERVLHKKRPIILYCQHGGSSMQLARRLGKSGFEVGTVIGGYEAMLRYRKSENW